jgi:membrane associated rhomboid family serine protease
MLDEFKNAFQRHNNAHIQLIIINVVVFVALAVLFVLSRWFSLDQYFTLVYDQFSIPHDFGSFIQRPWTLFTYFFTHSIGSTLGSILHIVFNMFALYWFGRLFVEYLGSDKLIAVYVLGGIAGAVLYLMVYNLIPNPPDFIANSPGVMVGASAAIFAIMVAITTLLPDYTFFLMFIGPVKLKYIAAIYIFLSFIGSVGANAGGEIAHLGGALIGFVYTKQLQAGANWGSWVTVTLDWIKGLFTSKPKVKVTYRKPEPVRTSAGASPSAKASKASQEEIDAILDKISDRGYESLTKEEKEKLFNASKK